MSNMFDNLVLYDRILNLSGINAPSVVNLTDAFKTNTYLNLLDLSSFNISSATNTYLPTNADKVYAKNNSDAYLLCGNEGNESSYEHVYVNGSRVCDIAYGTEHGV